MSHPCDIYQELRSLYDHCNAHFFNNTLPACMILLRPRRHAAGYFQPSCWGRFHDDATGDIDAIALNTTLFHARSNDVILSTLVHEMVHLWQRHYGDNFPKTLNHHNKEWSAKMHTVGLIPSTTGKEGGKETGLKVGHYQEVNGVFQQFYATLQPPLFSWQEMPETTPGKTAEKKVMSLCPRCEARAWAYEGVKLICSDCKEYLVLKTKEKVS